MSILGDSQRDFARMVGLLLIFIYSQPGYAVTFGDAWAEEGEGRKHSDDSFHYDRLAIDLNLFYNGTWLKETEDHRRFGEYWESLDSKCSWGGFFKRKDGNHYSYGEGR